MKKSWEIKVKKSVVYTISPSIGASLPGTTHRSWELVPGIKAAVLTQLESAKDVSSKEVKRIESIIPS